LLIRWVARDRPLGPGQGNKEFVKWYKPPKSRSITAKPIPKNTALVYQSTAGRFCREFCDTEIDQVTSNKTILRHANLSTTQCYLGKISNVEAIRWFNNIYGYGTGVNPRAENMEYGTYGICGIWDVHKNINFYNSRMTLPIYWTRVLPQSHTTNLYFYVRPGIVFTATD